MTDLTAEKQAALRAPFPPSAIQHIAASGQQLAYVGHAHVTDRLLAVDPEWFWEPMAYDANGLPLFDADGGLWIRLTVCGVTRIGYGEPQGRDAHDRKKGAIGNALRVAAMRFGVGLDLWAKEKIEPAAPVKPAATNEDVVRWANLLTAATTVEEVNAVVHEVTAHATSDKQLAVVKSETAKARARIAGEAS